MLQTTRSLERRLGDSVRTRLPAPIVEIVMFGLKMAWASLFAGLMLGAILLSAMFWPQNAAIARYDFLVVFAVSVQTAFLVLKLETWREAKVILLFHLSGTVMEVFKIHMGSWAYPEAGLLKIAGVPLFSGFMYASVGSFMARAIRIFGMAFRPFPHPFWNILLASAIYLNFFSHHFGPDMRVPLILATVVWFWRTRVYFTPFGQRIWMPMLLSALLSSGFLYIAENVGTLTQTWIYSGASASGFTPPAKIGSWYLLLYVSFAQVTLVYRGILQGKETITAP